MGSFTLIVGGIGVSNIMYVVVEERTREIGIKLAVGAKPRFIQGQFLTETLTLTAVGGLLGFLITLLVMAVFPKSLDEYVGTPQASPLVSIVRGMTFVLIRLDSESELARVRTTGLDVAIARDEGWDEGIALFGKGGKGTLYIPSTMAYGAQSPTPLIPANSVLVFDVEVVDTKHKKG